MNYIPATLMMAVMAWITWVIVKERETDKKRIARLNSLPKAYKQSSNTKTKSK